MRYKNRFEPQERLTSKGWVRPQAEARFRSAGRTVRLGEALGRQASGLRALTPPLSELG